ncbi:MAG: hypothetical protein V1821_04050 [bacterium]
MGKPITIGQSHATMQVLANNVRWEELDPETLQVIIERPQEVQITEFLRNRGKVIVGEPKILKIDRSRLFDPEKFIGEGWSFWKGPATGDGKTGLVEQDRRSLALTEFDLGKAGLKSCLKEGEEYVGGEEFLKRLTESGEVRLDAGVFLTFWENKHLYPAAWKELTNGNTTFVYFFGSPLRDPSGRRCVLYLYFEDGRLDWRCRYLEDGWLARRLAGVLA